MRNIIIIGAVIILLGTGFVGYQVFKTPEAASGPIEAVPLATTSTTADNSENDNTDDNRETVTDEATAENASVEDDATSEDTVAQEGDAGQANASETANSEESNDTEAETSDEGTAETEEAILFEIVPEESEARFLIDEVLRGSPTTVVGVTDQVAGQIAVQPEDLSTVQLGVIQVNARDLATDNNFRNRAIKNVILETDAHEFVIFTPTALTGLPDTGTVGETYEFQIVGDLTVKDTTREVTFDATVTPVSDTELNGTAATNILYRDFNLFIPDATSVDTVDDEVRLELEFVARAIS